MNKMLEMLKKYYMLATTSGFNISNFSDEWFK